MTLLGPAEALLIAVIAFHVILLAELGPKGYLWVQVLSRRLLFGRVGWVWQIAAAVLVCDLARSVYSRIERVQRSGDFG